MVDDGPEQEACNDRKREDGGDQREEDEGLMVTLDIEGALKGRQWQAEGDERGEEVGEPQEVRREAQLVNLLQVGEHLPGASEGAVKTWVVRD